MPYIIKIATHNIVLTYFHIFMYIVMCHASNARLCIYCHSSIQRTRDPRHSDQYKAFQSIVDETGVSCNTRATNKTTDANYFAVCSSTVLNLSDMIWLGYVENVKKMQPFWRKKTSFVTVSLVYLFRVCVYFTYLMLFFLWKLVMSICSESYTGC